MSVLFNTPETVFINSFKAAANVTFKGILLFLRA